MRWAVLLGALLVGCGDDDDDSSFAGAGGAMADAGAASVGAGQGGESADAGGNPLAGRAGGEGGEGGGTAGSARGGTAGIGGTISTGEGGEAGVPWVVCNQLDWSASKQVLEQRVSEPEPPPQGGDIIDGVYDLTAITRYGVTQAGPGSWSEAGIIKLDGEGFELVAVPQDEQESVSSGTVSVQDSDITLTDVCPSNNVFSTPYTATPTTLLWYRQGSVFTYAKREPI